MKLSYTLFLLVFSYCTISATTYRVSNVPNDDPDFTNLIDAHAIARSGDTLLIEGSDVSYGRLTMTKKLVIIGTGYFLDQNTGNSVGITAKIDQVVLDPSITSNLNSGASGSELIGLQISTPNANPNIGINVNDVIVKKCLTGDIRILASTVNNEFAVGTQVLQCYLIDDINSSRSNSPIVNIQILNNIFVGTFGLSLVEGSSGAILHNIFENGLYLERFAGEIRSNIVVTTTVRDVVLPVLPNNQISHNVAAAGQFGDANGNFTTIVDNLFVGEAENSTDGQWQLKPNSLAANRAHDGTDIGPYGGAIPYVLSGQGGSPAIIFFEAEPVGTNSETLKIRIRARSSN